jgi:hypothetical protein
MVGALRHDQCLQFSARAKVNNIRLFKFSSSTFRAAVVVSCNGPIEFMNAREAACLTTILAEESKREQIEFDPGGLNQHKVTCDPVARESLRAILKSGRVDANCVHQSGHVNILYLPPADSFDFPDHMPI